MQTITVMDMNEAGMLSFDLRDLLACVAQRAMQMNWRVRDLECMGERADELQYLADQNHLISGPHLIAIADGSIRSSTASFLGMRRATQHRHWCCVQWIAQVGISRRAAMRCSTHFEKNTKS